MKKDVNKMLKRILVFLMFFMCINTVNAKKSVDVTTTQDLYKKCDETKDCLVLCKYNDDAADEKYKDLNNSEKAYVAYYGFDGNNIREWEIGIIRPSAEKLYTFTNAMLPYTDIYWGGYSKNGKKTWNLARIEVKSNDTMFVPYDKLSDELECPKYLNFDTDADPEICFSNEPGKCEEHNVKLKKDFSKEKDNSLKYSFLEDELKPIIDNVYNELYIFDSTTSAMINNPSKYPSEAATIIKLEEEKIKFLAEVDPELRKIYDSNKSAQDNAINYCPTLAEKLKDQKAYVETLGNINDYVTIIDNQLNFEATLREVKNTNVYTLESLERLLKYRDSSGTLKERKIKDPLTNMTYIDKLNSIYSNNVNSSVSYIRSICNNMTETNIEYDEEELRKDTKDRFTTTIYENISFDKTTQFDCGTLGELADLVKTGYFIIEIVALVILIVFTVLDYAKVILSGEQEEMKKTNKRLKTRLIIMIAILLLPALINFILGVFNIEGFNSENPLCVEIKNK